MPAPVISTIVSLDDGKIGVHFSFGPSATNTPFSWRAEQLPPGLAINNSATFTVDAATNIVTLAANIKPIDGMKMRLGSSNTLPAGLSAGVDAFIINSDPDTNTCKLSATLGGSQLDITDAGTGTHYIWNPETLGQINGVPTSAGFWNTKLYASNASGESAVLELPIGIQDAGVLLPGTPLLKWDLQTNEVTPYTPGASASSSSAAAGSTDPAPPVQKTPVIFGTNLDIREYGIVLAQGDQIVDLAVHTLNLGVKDFETDPIILLGDNSFTKSGQDDTAAYVIALDYAAVPDSPSKVLDNELEDEFADDSGTGFDGLAQLQMTYISPVTGNLLKISSKVFDARIERSIQPS